MSDPGKRLPILEAKKIRELYGLPRFSSEERLIYFELETPSWSVLETIRTHQSKIYFILQLGYFKAKKMFFSFDFEEAEDDVQHIVKRYYPDIGPIELLEIPKRSRKNQQDKILDLFSYRLCKRETKKKLKAKAVQVAALSAKPIFIFYELLNYLENTRTVIPAYSYLQEVVGKALAEERKRMEFQADEYIPPGTRARLDKLIETRSSLYELTFIKKEPKNFKHDELKQEGAKRQILKPLYDVAVDFLPRLGISNENIKYYASLAEYYTVYKLQRMKGSVVYIYLMCFVFNRYQKIHDNLVSSFIHYVNKYSDEAKEAARDEIYNLKTESNENLEKAGKVLDFFMDEKIPDKQSFGEVRQKAFEILRREKFAALSKYIAGIKFDEAEYEWNYYEKKGPTFKKNLRPLFLAIDFKSLRKDDPLMAAVSILKEILRDKRKITQIRNYVYPQIIIPPTLQKYLYDVKETKIEKKSWQLRELNVTKFEFLIYQLLLKRLESYDIAIKDSILFKSFEEDLVDDEKWKNKDQLILDLELPYLHKPIDEILDALEEELENKITEVNARIREGQNPHIKITKRKDNIRWSLPYPKSEDPENHPLYDQLPQIEIYDLLIFVAEKTKLMEAFEHILETYVKGERDDQAIIACIIAFGTNTGIKKMEEISDIGYQALFRASNNFIRLETLKKGNDLISNMIAQLPIFKYYNVEEDVIHAGSDGQKFETQIDIFRSRYSPKYFGLDKGVVSYTLAANSVALNAKMFGANDHESHFLFDVVKNNTSDIRPDRVSTDTHGRNNVNSAILHIFGYLFAPRLKTLNQDSRVVYGFQNAQAYQDCLIKPIRKINRTLIKEEWESIQRIIVSLALKETTQSIIIRKLSSTKRKNKTKKALWEYDNIISSLYYLSYIDNPLLRKHVQKSLNRVESYHRLKRAIFHDNSGKFRVKTEVEQEIWSECTRLIANCVIFYNSYFLSKVLEERKKAGLLENTDIFSQISPVAWKHINFCGRFEFQRENEHSAENIERILDSGISFLFS